MTNEEKSILIPYLADAGEIDPGGDLEEQFQDWCQVRGSVVSGEVHYKAILEAARIRARSFSEGRQLVWPRAQPSWTGTRWHPPLASTALSTTSARRRVTPPRSPRGFRPSIIVGGLACRDAGGRRA